MVLWLISSRSECVAVNAAQAYEFVAGILCIIFFTSFFTYFFFLLLFAPTFCSDEYTNSSLNIVKSPVSLTHTCVAFCIGIGIVSVSVDSSC